MIRLETKNFNTILIEMQQKYQHYHPEKLININILQVKKQFCRQIKEEAKSAYSSLEKTFEKQTEKQVDAIKYLDFSNKLKKIKGIYPQNLMNDLICAKLKEFVGLQNIINQEQNQKQNQLNTRNLN